MKRQKELIFLLTIFLLTCILSYNMWFTSSKFVETDQNESESLSTCSAGLAIVGDLSLSLAASRGNGSKMNPYIIENLTINGWGKDYVIIIRDTTAYFMLQHCTVFNGTTGIYLDNVINGILYNNSVFLNKMGGIDLFQSPNNTISKNLIINNNGSALHVSGSNNNTIILNNITHNDLNIMIMSSHANTLIKNAVSDSSSAGISLVLSNYNILLENNLSHISSGVYIADSSNNTLMKNSIWESSTGIDLWDSNNNSLLENTITNNTYGISLIYSNYNIIENNFLGWNTLVGIYLNGATYNRIIHNTLAYNKEPIVQEANCFGNIIQDNTLIPESGIPGFTWFFLFVGSLFLILIHIKITRKRTHNFFEFSK